MRKRLFNVMLAALLIGAVAACDEESSILDPDTSPQGIELGLMVDEDLVDAVIADAEAALDATLGPASGGAFEGQLPGLFAGVPDHELVQAARAKLEEECRPLFQQAREAWRHGDAEEAANYAHQGRYCVAEALVMVFGEEAYDHLWQRLEQIKVWLEERVDEEASELLSRINELMEEAEGIKNNTDREDALTQATERLVLALQIGHRERAHHRHREMASHARLSVFMGHSALQLAAQVVAEGAEPTEEQVRVLQHAQHLVAHAAEALDVGRYALAFGLAREAVNVALVAVMLEPGIEQARVEAMVQLAQMAITAAEDATAGLNPQSFAVRLLEQAKNLQERGNAIAFTQPRAAIYVLWHASITAYGVIGLVSG